MMRRVETVPTDQRSRLKKLVDKIGRQSIADSIDMRYTTLSHKLNGVLPLSESDFERINQACDTIEQK